MERGPECESAMVQGLQYSTDAEILGQLQRDPQLGRFYVTLFCRHEPGIQRLLEQWWGDPSVPGSWQHELWHHLFDQMGSLDPEQVSESLQPWIQAQAQQWCLTQNKRAKVEDRADLDKLSPVLTWFVERAMAQMDPVERFMVVLWDRWSWSAEQIAAQLSQEGYLMDATMVIAKMDPARESLWAGIPADIRGLYLAQKL